MKRAVAILLALLLLLLTGCAAAAAQDSAASEVYQLYYIPADLSGASGSDALEAAASSLRTDTSRTPQMQAKALLAQLFSAPTDENLKSPVPTGTQILDVIIKDGHAAVDLSSAYGSLSGVSLTLADYAITMTLTQIPDVSSVSITVLGQELAYRDAQNFTAEDLLHASTEDVVGTLEVTLYFLNAEQHLVGEKRTLELYEGDTQAAVTADALRDGPQNSELTSPLPEGFAFQSVWLENDVCYVNLPTSALQEMDADAAHLQMALLALSKSLLSLDAVTEVQFLSDGEFTGSYGGAAISHAFGAAAG
jgi:germination protein M